MTSTQPFELEIESQDSSLVILGHKRSRSPSQHDDTDAKSSQLKRPHIEDSRELSTEVQSVMVEHLTQSQPHSKQPLSQPQLVPESSQELEPNYSSEMNTNEVTDETKILLVRGKFPEIIVLRNKEEDWWRCDVCLSMEGDNDDELAICDLCLVVVHPSCYRRDLYAADPEDASPWFCARCKFLMQEMSNYSVTYANEDAQTLLPNCSLCVDQQGAILDLTDGSWVHIACVNWINEIWFETEDYELRMYGGQLDFGRYSLTCYICRVHQGQCIECDLRSCWRPFHVRCAMRSGFIQPPEEMDSALRLGDWDCKIFCEKHQRKGSKQVREIKAARSSFQQRRTHYLNVSFGKNLADEPLTDGDSDLQLVADRVQTRLRTGAANRHKRSSVVDQIDIDRMFGNSRSSCSPQKRIKEDDIISATPGGISVQSNPRKVNIHATLDDEPSIENSVSAADSGSYLCGRVAKAKKSKTKITDVVSIIEVDQDDNDDVEVVSEVIRPLPLRQLDIPQPMTTEKKPVFAPPRITNSKSYCLPSKQANRQLSAAAGVSIAQDRKTAPPYSMENSNDLLQPHQVSGLQPATQVFGGTKVVSNTIAVRQSGTRASTLRRTLTIEDIVTECPVKFKIDKPLANYLNINEWCTFKDITIGFLKFNQKVKDFYDKQTLSFNAYKYPFFMRFFPDQAKITSLDLKRYLLRKHQ